MESTFHLAFPIKDLYKSKEFYCTLLDCEIGRETPNWMDINFFGHQLTIQVNPDAVRNIPFHEFGKSPFPVHHFGLVLSWRNWHLLQDKLIQEKVDFIIKPQIVFQGEVGEQKTLFIQDPSGYFIEFKTFEDIENVFKTTPIK
jgi:uncharacterized protein|tara:strand:+ start:91 stop:519 length:429 start_codon:yes stop_codon:yes gene_type:complete